MKPNFYIALLLLGALWGASFLFIGLAVPEFGPLPLMFLRVLGGGGVLLVTAVFWKHQSGSNIALNLRENWKNYLMVGLLNSALPFTLIAFSELYITISLAAILNATTPLFAVLMAALWQDEVLTRRKTFGAFWGIVGVAVLVGVGYQAVTPQLIVGVTYSLLGAFCYGAGTVYAAKHMRGLPTIYAAATQLLSAAVILIIPALLFWPMAWPSAKAILSLVALMLLSTCLAYLLYFYLLKVGGAARTTSVTFLVPVFGTAWAILFLQEQFTTGMLLGLAIILTSVGLVAGGQKVESDTS